MRTLSAATIVGLAVVLAACTSGTGASSSTPAAATPAAATPAPSDEAATATPASGTEAPATVAVASTSLGDVLAGGDGRTLYVFLPDQGGVPTCYDACATAWPPLVVDGTPTGGTGLTAGDLGTVARTDGGTQVTFDGWPLYFYAGDAAPGDVNGQGVGGNWYVIGPDGTVVGAPAASDSQLKY